MHDGLRQTNALFVTARQALDQLIALIRNVGQAHGFIDALADVRSGHALDSRHKFEI